MPLDGKGAKLIDGEKLLVWLQVAKDAGNVLKFLPVFRVIAGKYLLRLSESIARRPNDLKDSVLGEPKPFCP